MSRLVMPTYDQTIVAIREAVLDLSPVSCFTVKKQGFVLSALTDKLSFATTVPDEVKEILYADNPKLYDVLLKCNELGIETGIEKGYVPNEQSKYIVPVESKAITDAYMLKRKNYFSVEEINVVITDFFWRFLDKAFSCETPDDAQTMMDDYLCYADVQRMVLWVAFHLLEKRRMNQASADFLKQQNSEALDVCDDKVANITQQVTTRVGDSFTIVEQETDTGLGFEDFSALWGDKYAYLTKLQLYIRTRYEQLFGDFSLRESTVNSTSVVMEKYWQPYAYVDTHTLSELTTDVLLPAL